MDAWRSTQEKKLLDVLARLHRATAAKSSEKKDSAILRVWNSELRVAILFEDCNKQCYEFVFHVPQRLRHMHSNCTETLIQVIHDTFEELPLLQEVADLCALDLEFQGWDAFSGNRKAGRVRTAMIQRPVSELLCGQGLSIAAIQAAIASCFLQQDLCYL